MNRQRTVQVVSVERSKQHALFPSPLLHFGFWATLGAIAIVVMCKALFDITPDSSAVFFGIPVYGVAVMLVGVGLHHSYPHAILGWCNLVTLTRLVIAVVLVIVVIAKMAPNWITFAIALLALSLDGVDGWLARKQGLSSNFGARFDVETDALFALVLAVYAATNGAAGPWVILLGLPHYLFWVAKRALPWLNQALPDRLSRKLVCVAQIAALIALQVPLFSGMLLDVAIGVVTISLVWSFGRDIIWLRRVH